ncbi:MAG: PQQ-binding-like beta-propeller repeat protein [Myxococcaceae bacterium]|nr:PQQ-binding-like beta-propeller repeat protein [Myxococcaceae bacterium]
MHRSSGDASIRKVALLAGLALALSGCDQAAELSWSWAGEGPSRSGLTEVDGGVIFGNEAGALVRLDETGRVRWRVQVGREIAARPAVVGDVVVAATTSGEWLGVSLQTGAEKWRLGGKPALTVPLASDDQRAYAVADDGSVFAISGSSGGTAWRLLPPRGVGDAAGLCAPVAKNGRLHVALGKAGLFALNPADGETLWRRSVGEVVGFLVEGARLYAATREGRVLALDAGTGAVEWERTLDEKPQAGPWLARGLLWIAFDERGLMSLDPQDGAETWRVQLPAPARGGVAAWREIVLVPTDGREGRLWGLRPGQAEPVVNLRADSALRTAPRVFGDTVLTLASDGRVLAWKIKRASR